MKKVSLILLVVFAAMTVAMAQSNPNYSSPTDVLGAHLVYGRGCVACHAPHSGARGNGISTTDPTTGNVALWGADLAPYYSKNFAFGDAGAYTYTAPANSSAGAHDSQVGIMLCLSCHDGNFARNGMMTGQTVETIPNNIGGHAPTLLGNDGTPAGNYNNDHPVGPLAIVGCGGQYNWDCTDNGNGTISMNGPFSSQFVLDYGNVVKLSAYNNHATVTCMSCHDQHSMTAYAGKIGNVTGTFQTMFFVRGYYNPGSPTSNSAAQFCRNCHGGESNEMHNTNLPTT
jgi:cytochrome c553